MGISTCSHWSQDMPLAPLLAGYSTWTLPPVPRLFPGPGPGLILAVGILVVLAAVPMGSLAPVAVSSTPPSAPSAAECERKDCAQTPSPTLPPSGAGLGGVSVSPPSGSVTVGGRISFTALPSCTGGNCPAGVDYAWSMNRDLGQLSYTSALPNTVFDVISPGERVPAGIAFDSANGDLYVTDDNQYSPYALSNVSVISGATDTTLGLIQVGASPTGIGYDPANGYLYVTNCGSGTMSVINGANNSLVTTFPFSLAGCMIGAKWFMNYAGVAYDPASDTIYASNYGYGTVSVIDPATDRIEKTLRLGGEPWGLVYDPANRDLYATEFSQNYVAVINGTTNSILTQVLVGSLPSGIDYDAANKMVYVADAGYWVKAPAGYGNITVIDTTTNSVSTTIFVRGYPWSVAYDSGNGCVYETDSNTTLMNVLSGTSESVIDTVPIGRTARGYSSDFADAYDPQNGFVYVTGFNSSLVDVLGGTSDVITFTAGGTIGSFDLFANATWNGSNVVSPAVNVSVISSPFPVITSFSTSPNPIAAGETTLLRVSAEGGTGALSYAFAGLPPGCTSSDVSSLSCIPSAAGNYLVRVYVNDTTGHTANATTRLSVSPGTYVPPSVSPGTRAQLFGLPSWEVYLLSLVVGVIVVAVALGWWWRGRRAHRSSSEPSRAAPSAAPTGTGESSEATPASGEPSPSALSAPPAPPAPSASDQGSS